MNSMCTELNVSLARKRTDKEQKDIVAKWTELGTIEPDLTRFRPVYAAKDFLDVISALKNTNQVSCGDPSVFRSYWGIIQVPLSVKTMHQLQVYLLASCYILCYALLFTSCSSNTKSSAILSDDSTYGAQYPVADLGN